MKIVFAIASLGPGGAERVQSILVKQWLKAKHTVEIVCFDHEGGEAYYDIPTEIKIHRLGLNTKSRFFFQTLYRTLTRILKLRQFFKKAKPDIIVSFITEMNILSVWATTGLKIPIVISERVHPEAHKIGKLVFFLRKYTYPKASCLVVQTFSVAKWFNERLGIESKVIANPTGPIKLSYPRIERQEKRLLAAGRLTRQKGFDILISAFKASAKPGWILDIYGEGEERNALQKQICDAGLSNSVFLLGDNKNVQKEMALCTAFVHSARYEGFPNVVLEALSKGCCVVAVDSPGGIAEILKQGRYGIQVKQGNEMELANALASIMTEPNLRKGYEKLAFEAVRPYRPKKIAQNWLEIFEALRVKVHKN